MYPEFSAIFGEHLYQRNTWIKSSLLCLLSEGRSSTAVLLCIPTFPATASIMPVAKDGKGGGVQKGKKAAPKVKAAAMKSATKSAPAMKSAMKKGGGAAGSSSAAAPKAKAKKPEKPPLEKPDYYLIKSEPLTRMEKGQDMRFSIDDLIAHVRNGQKGVAEWDGVGFFGRGGQAIGDDQSGILSSGDRCW